MCIIASDRRQHRPRLRSRRRSSMRCKTWPQATAVEWPKHRRRAESDSAPIWCPPLASHNARVVGRLSCIFLYEAMGSPKLLAHHNDGGLHVSVSMTHASRCHADFLHHTRCLEDFYFTQCTTCPTAPV